MLRLARRCSHASRFCKLRDVSFGSKPEIRLCELIRSSPPPLSSLQPLASEVRRPRPTILTGELDGGTRRSVRCEPAETGIHICTPCDFLHTALRNRHSKNILNLAQELRIFPRARAFSWSRRRDARRPKRLYEIRSDEE